MRVQIIHMLELTETFVVELFICDQISIFPKEWPLIWIYGSFPQMYHVTNYSQFYIHLVLILLGHWHDLPRHLNGTEPTLMLLTAPVIFLLAQSEKCPLLESFINKQTTVIRDRKMDGVLPVGASRVFDTSFSSHT